MSASATALSEVNGQRFGHLVAVGFHASLQGRGRGVRRWEFRCDCGNMGVYPLAAVRRGQIKSCGCFEVAKHRRDVAANLNGFAERHGRYEREIVAAKVGLVETEFTEAVVNRTHSVIDGWIDEEIFLRRHIRVIEHARDLWREIKRPTHNYFDSHDPEDRQDGLDAERAKNLLRRARSLVARDDWNVFENVVRWNEPTGIPGPRHAGPSPRSVAAAKETVLLVAEIIAEALFL